MRFVALALLLAGCGASTPPPVVDDGRPECLRVGEEAEAQGEMGRAEDAYARGCDRRWTRCCEGAARTMIGRAPLRDVVKAYERACTRFDPDVCLRAGGDLASHAPEEAATFYERSCFDAYGEIGGRPRDPESCRRGLDAMLALGRDDEARRMSRVLCGLFLTSGCGTLAVLLAEGRGGPVALEKAYATAKRACEEGHGASCTLAEDLLRRLREQERIARCEDVPAELRDARLEEADGAIGPFSAGGLQFCGAACRAAPGADTAMNGLLVGPLVASAMSGRRDKLAACGEKATPVIVRFEVVGGVITEVAAEGDEALRRCVEQSLAQARVGFEGRCQAVLRLP